MSMGGEPPVRGYPGDQASCVRAYDAVKCSSAGCTPVCAKDRRHARRMALDNVGTPADSIEFSSSPPYLRSGHTR